jgi:hypothetical protein
VSQSSLPIGNTIGGLDAESAKQAFLKCLSFNAWHNGMIMFKVLPPVEPLTDPWSQNTEVLVLFYGIAITEGILRF